MADFTLPDFASGLPAARVDAALRQALGACDRAHKCAVLWFAEVHRRGLYRQLGHASLQLYATQAPGFSDIRYYQFKRLAADLDRLPVLREAVETGEIGWTRALQVARVATAATQTAWVAKAATTGRRELELQVRQARKRRPAAPAAQLDFDAPAQPAFGAPAQLEALTCDARVQRPGKPNRATMPPSVRAAVLARDRHRCATPGCRSAHFLEVHHVMPRGRGGTNRVENLITLCSRGHGFVHEGGGGFAAALAPALAHF
jgi:5-methylcytosine-specific restriction endonuclease McrA